MSTFILERDMRCKTLFVHLTTVFLETISRAISVYNVFCRLLSGSGVFLPEVLPGKEDRGAPFQDTVIDTGVGQVRRVLEFGQLQVGGDDHGPAANVGQMSAICPGCGKSLVLEPRHPLSLSLGRGLANQQLNIAHVEGAAVQHFHKAQLQKDLQGPTVPIC